MHAFGRCQNQQPRDDLEWRLCSDFQKCVILEPTTKIWM